MAVKSTPADKPGELTGESWAYSGATLETPPVPYPSLANSLIKNVSEDKIQDEPARLKMKR